MVGDLYTKEIGTNKFGIFRTKYPKDIKVFVGTEKECADFRVKMIAKILARNTQC